MKTMRFILMMWMTGNILLAGFLARSADFHAWLHIEDDFCHIEEVHCSNQGQEGHHHKSEGADKHPHGLLTLMAGSGIESTVIPFPSIDGVQHPWVYVIIEHDAPLCSTYRGRLYGRAPPSYC